MRVIDDFGDYVETQVWVRMWRDYLVSTSTYSQYDPELSDRAPI